MSFSSLKKQSSLGSLTSKLVKEIEKTSATKSGGADERLWKPELDKSGNGFAVIRFLPHLMVRTCLGRRSILTLSKDLVVGTSKTL